MQKYLLGILKIFSRPAVSFVLDIKISKLFETSVWWDLSLNKFLVRQIENFSIENLLKLLPRLHNILRSWEVAMAMAWCTAIGTKMCSPMTHSFKYCSITFFHYLLLYRNMCNILNNSKLVQRTRKS